MTGYQVGILYALGGWQKDNEYRRYCVRHRDRYFLDAVSPLFGTKMYEQQSHGLTQYVIKSSNVEIPALEDILDVKGFCRAYIEVHGKISAQTRHDRKTYEKYHVLRMRIYGCENVLNFIQANWPLRSRKLQPIENKIDGKYTGRTFELSVQGNDGVMGVLSYIDGLPRNEAVWDEWKEKIERIKEMDKNLRLP